MSAHSSRYISFNRCHQSRVKNIATLREKLTQLQREIFLKKLNAQKYVYHMTIHYINMIYIYFTALEQARVRNCGAGGMPPFESFNSFYRWKTSIPLISQSCSLEALFNLQPRPVFALSARVSVMRSRPVDECIKVDVISRCASQSACEVCNAIVLLIFNARFVKHKPPLKLL